MPIDVLWPKIPQDYDYDFWFSRERYDSGESFEASNEGRSIEDIFWYRVDRQAPGPPNVLEPNRPENSIKWIEKLKTKTHLWTELYKRKVLF